MEMYGNPIVAKGHLYENKMGWLNGGLPYKRGKATKKR